MKFMKLGSKPDAFQSDGSNIRFVLSLALSSVFPSKSFLGFDPAISLRRRYPFSSEFFGTTEVAVTLRRTSNTEEDDPFVLVFNALACY
ncbi:hypothetical protein GW17_00023101 [Ensete ventricosum]|nr:hypothetical protein GW17_00023101 [Ensete ventricosum]